jgi:hypothetical protein
VNVSITILKVLVIAVLLSIIFSGISLVVTYSKSTSHLIHWIHLVHLMLFSLSRITLFLALTLVVSVAPKCYLCKLTMTIHGPFGRHLLSVTIP